MRLPGEPGLTLLTLFNVFGPFLFPTRVFHCTSPFPPPERRNKIPAETLAQAR